MEYKTKKQSNLKTLFGGENDNKIPRILEIFSYLDITNAEDLVNNFAEDDITCYKQAGEKTLDYINQKLDKCGLKLRKHIPEKTIKKILEGEYGNKSMKEVGLDWYHYDWLKGIGLTSDINLSQLIDILEEEPKPFGLGKGRIYSIRKTLKDL